MKFEQKPAPSPESGPKITLPEDVLIVGALQRKLEEYKERLGGLMKGGPDNERDQTIDVMYKIAVLEELLVRGKVDKHNLRQVLLEKHSGVSDEHFDNAFGVIEDYIKTSGFGVVGGTGLSFEESPEGFKNSAARLTREIIKDSVRDGVLIDVNVKRSNGEVEGGWKLTGISDTEAYVVKTVEGGVVAKKVIPIEELLELN